MKHTTSYKFFILLLLTALFHGCIDDPAGEESTIEGTVYNSYGMYNPYALVSIGDYPIVATDSYGKFQLENNLYPYNITLARGRYNYTKYMGISLTNLKLQTLSSSGNSNNCNVNVLFPKLTSEYELAIIKFISNDRFNQFEETSVDSIFPLNIDILSNKTQIEGTLIFLQFTRYSGVHSYDKFGMKHVTLKQFGNQNIVFTNEDLEFNPPELYTYYDLQLNGNFTHWASNVSLHFPGMSTSSDISLLGYAENEISGYFVIPDIPMLNYNIKFTNYATNEYHSGFEFSKKWVYVNTGQDIHLTHNKDLNLISPANGETMISENTKFLFSDNEPGGVYVYKISSHNDLEYITLDIITDKYPLELRDFETWGFQFKPNTRYDWGVIKYPGYKNINELASINFMQDTLYLKIPASEWFSFTTQ